jgi:hypothetical protein
VNSQTRYEDGWNLRGCSESSYQILLTIAGGSWVSVIVRDHGDVSHGPERNPIKVAGNRRAKYRKTFERAEVVTGSDR